MLNLKTIKEARDTLKNIISKTPFSYATYLSKITNYEIRLKKENLQITGSFKIRGAFNKIYILIKKNNYKKGIIAVSAGNHAQGVAFSGKYFNIPVIIIMPNSTPLIKIKGVEEYGAKVILEGDNYDESYEYATKLAKDRNEELIHPFADDHVLSGQGTIALEMLEECKNLDAIIVPVGGGGLISGISKAIKSINKNIKIIGVSSAGAPAMQNSFDQKKVINTDSVRTIADGVAVAKTSKKTLNYILEHTDIFESVSEEEIANAILFLLEKQKILVEGAGAVGVAYILHHKIDLPKHSRIGIILSGGNIDITMLSTIIEKGLLKSYRKMKLRVVLMDKAGSLMLLTKILEELKINISQIGYDRISTKLKFGDAIISITLETKGKKHQEYIREKLRFFNFQFEETV